MAVIYTGTRAFPITPNPSVGDFYLGLDTSNSNRLTKQDSSGTLTDLESGAVYTDADAVAAFVAAFNAAPVKSEIVTDDSFLIRDSSDLTYKRATRGSVLLNKNPDRVFSVFTDFLGSVTGDFTASQSGSGASSQSGTYGQDTIERAIGVTQSDTGSTATGRAGIGLAAPASLRATIARYRMSARIAIEALSTPTENFTMRIGLTDSYLGAGDGTNGIYFRYNDLQNGGRWEAISRAGGVDLTGVDTGVSPDLDYHIFEIRLTEDGSEATFYYDDTLVATINAPLLPNATQPFHSGYKIEKSVGTAQRNMSADWMIFEIERSSAR